jgi:hypothetical protein
VLDVFHTLAEVAVAVTGFSSLIIIFRGSSSDWSRQDYVSFAFILSWSIGSIFLSLQPIVLVEFGMEVTAVAQVGLFSLAAYMIFVGSFLTYVETRIIRESGGRIKSRLNLVMSLLFLVIVSGAIVAGRGLLPGPPHAWFAVMIVLLMMHATAELGVFVVRTTRQSKSDQVDSNLSDGAEAEE